MPQFSQREQDAMRRDAQRRVQEMRQRVRMDVPPIPLEQLHSGSQGDSPPTPEPSPLESRSKPEPSRPRNPADLLSRLDSDTILILAIMAMLYRDGGWEGCDKKLLLALAYLLL